jgi:hypothetical protein
MDALSICRARDESILIPRIVLPFHAMTELRL